MNQPSRTIIITRPEIDSQRLARYINEIDTTLHIMISPLHEIIFTHVQLNLNDYQGIIFTSENAVRALSRQNIPHSLTAYCIGQRTAIAAKNIGFMPYSADNSAESLVRLVAKMQPKGNLLYARGKTVSTDLAKSLLHHNICINELIVYEQQPCPLSDRSHKLLGNSSCLVVLYSVNTAIQFTREAGCIPNKDHLVFCISKNVCDAFTLNWKTVMPKSLSIKQNAREITLYAVSSMG